MTRFALSFADLDVHSVSDDHENTKNEYNDSRDMNDLHTDKSLPTMNSNTMMFEYSDDESDDNSNSSSSSSSSSSSTEPLEYSIGKTRFCLSHAESMEQYRRRWGYISLPTTDWTSMPKERDDDDKDHSQNKHSSNRQQQFPPLSNYLDSNTAPTSALVRMIMKKNTPSKHHHTTTTVNQHQLVIRGNDDDGNNFVNQDMDRLATLLEAAAIMERYEPALPPTTTATTTLMQLQQQRARDELKIQNEMKYERQRISQEQEQAAQALRMLIHDQETKAKQIRDAELNLIRQQQQKDADEKKQQLEQQKAQQEQVSKLKPEETQGGSQSLGRASPPDLKAAVALEKETVPAAIPEYLERAQKIKAQLVQLQANVKPFDTSTDPNIKKRRLAMKKIVNGKVNTLAENADKIREVAAEVANAIAQARAEDEGLKASQNDNSSVPPEASRGKRYLVNLLAEKVIVRAQAEGFNGQRGDGFPLAHMLAMVSEEAKDFGIVMAAHIFTVCPTAIPSLPHIAPDASEEELMESLGMLKLKDGNYETFEKFLARTEGIISLVADIMASNPPTHTLLGGKGGAIKWLSRFLDDLPEAPQSPLPLLTAPVLDAFLTGAGHMLANTYPDEFRKCLDRVTDDIVRRLDESSIGMPSATRLKKTVSGGFEGFQQKLPSKAIAEFYHGAQAGSKHHGGSSGAFAKSSNDSKSPFAPASFAGSQPLPFGRSNDSKSPFAPAGFAGSQPLPFGNTPAVTTQPFSSTFGMPQSIASNDGGIFPSGNNAAKQQPCKFFAQGHCKFGKNCKFSHETSNGQASPFGTNTNNPNPFSGATAPSPFQPAASNSSIVTPNVSTTQNPFNSNAPAVPFGQTSSSTTASGMASPFGQPPAAAPSTFGGASPFGSSNMTPSFGQPTQMSQPSPFGGTASVINNNFGTSSSPFGPSTVTNPSPFSGVPSSTNPSTIGSSPFHQSTAPANSFGSNSNPLPFGQATGPSPSAFGNSLGPNSNSAGFSNASNPFGAPNTSPFGNTVSMNTSNNASLPFGSSQQQSNNAFSIPTQAASFGAPISGTAGVFGSTSGTSTNSPFGQGQQNTNNPFGNNAIAPSPFSSQQTFSQQTSPFSNPSNLTGNTFGSSKQPCKFYAEGRCKFGTSCKFSHDTQPFSGFGRF